MDFTLEQFNLIKTVGRGSFGKVCLTQHKPSKSYHAMKIISLKDVIRLEQVEHVKNEKKILEEVQHPFLISLTWWSLDSHHLYLVTPFIGGGELFSYLRCYGSFSLDTTLFYVTEVITALSYLHSLNIVYRDLKPENILLDSQGHIVLTDMGFAKHLLPELRTWTMCGTSDYMAPELILDTGHHHCVDWWALGILTYELLTGNTPFPATSQLYSSVLLGKIDWPEDMDDMARDFIKRLLVRDCKKRLGHGHGGADKVRDHKLFLSIDWTEVEERKMTPPIIPKMTHPADTRNFEQFAEPKWNKQRLSKEEMKLFEDF